MNYYYLNIIYQSEPVCLKENFHLMSCFMNNKVFELKEELNGSSNTTQCMIQ